MSEDQNNDSSYEESQNPLIQIAVLLSLFLLAVIVPFIFVAFFSVLIGIVSLNTVPGMLSYLVTYLFTPYSLVKQWEVLFITSVLLIMILFVWPKRFDEKAWCAGLVLFFHSIIGGYFIFVSLVEP
ncbi:hypothetical protein [Gimesia sp.]|uniref:hypothetical protein n=1 Tax=Gimesia sp. TaxID=2024833 RepID=UPI003A949B84